MKLIALIMAVALALSAGAFYFTNDKDNPPEPVPSSNVNSDIDVSTTDLENNVDIVASEERLPQLPSRESFQRQLDDAEMNAYDALLVFDKPLSTSSFTCNDDEFAEGLVCADSRDPNWMQLLDDESLFELGRVDPYAAYLASYRLATKDPDRAFLYSLRSVALSGKLVGLLHNKQPQEGAELTDELFAALDQHEAVTTKLYQDIVLLNGFQMRDGHPLIQWDVYLAEHPEKAEEMQATLTEWKAFIDSERQTVLGDVFFAGVSQ